jgi:hypothetical protein
VDNLLVKAMSVEAMCGQFISKCYECGGLFHFFISNSYNKSLNYICDGIN